ncbi:MAG: hypothetical protein QG622_2223 [Actinomycetota bacterium]|nr:hypothetical protein [Actinomycetota bacterium]
MTGPGRLPDERPDLPDSEQTVEYPRRPPDERTVPFPVRPRDDEADKATADLLRGVLSRRAEAVRPSADGLARILAAAREAEGPGAGPAPVETRTSPRATRWSVSRIPSLLAAAAAVLLVGGLGLARFGVIHSPGLANVVGDPASSVPSPRPSAVEPLPVYLVQRQNDRWAVVREFVPTTLAAPAERLAEALRLSITGEGTDPDHSSAWVEAGFQVDTSDLTVTSAENGVAVTLSPELIAAGSSATSTRALADLAIAQLVWTATATVHRNEPVRVDGPPGTRLFGVTPLNRTFQRDTRPATDLRAPVWVSSLVDGQKIAPGRAVVQGDAVRADGDTVTWRLLREGSGTPLADGTVPLRTKAGAVPRIGERGVWQVTLQLPDEGQYEFQVSQPWPGSSGTLWTDTKTLLVD